MVGRRIAVNDVLRASTNMIYNFSPEKFGRYRAKLAGAFAGLNRAKIAFEGDSLTAGQGAGTSTYFETNAKVNAIPAHLARLMRKAGLIVSEDSIMGDNTVLVGGMAGITNYDPRAVFTGTGWTRSNRMLVSQSLRSQTVTDKLAFTPTSDTSNITVYAARNSGFGSYTIADGASVLATVNAAGSQAFVGSSASRASSANTWNIEHSAAGDIYIGGVDCWNTDTQLSIYNLGSSGSKSIDLTGVAAAWSPINAKNVLDPDIAVINIGTNDVRSNVSAETFLANLGLSISAHKTAGRDVVLVAPNPDNAPGYPLLLPQIAAARYSLADTYDVPLVDIGIRYGSYAAGNALGLYQDAVHQLSLGYADQAMALFEILRPR